MDNIINIGKNRELFWDDYILDTSKTKTETVVHQFKKQECVLTFDGACGGDDCHIMSILDDGEKFRMYINSARSKLYTERTCDNAAYVYCESTDGIHWEKPILGIREAYGSKENNFLFPKDEYPFCNGIDGFFVMKDTNPLCKPGEEYKATGISDKELIILTSPDAIHFTKKYVMTAPGEYDSINTLLFDDAIGKYRCYYRVYHPDASPAVSGWKRGIMLSESEDLIHWSKPECLSYSDYMDWQLYMNGISKYKRASQIYMGFPTRYVERQNNAWQTSYEGLKESERRKHLNSIHGRAATAVSDSLFMMSRDGKNWTRYNDAILTPGAENGLNWIYGDAYLSNVPIETKSLYRDCDNELSMFAGEKRWSGMAGEIYRYTMRLDGFVSRHAPWDNSWDMPSLMTKPFIYDGDDMFINFSTSAYGGVKLDIMSLTENRSIESGEMFGDATDRKVLWKNGSPREFRGQPVIVTYHMHDSDIYSFRFE